MRTSLTLVAIAGAVVAVVLGVVFVGDTVGTALDRGVYDALKGSVPEPSVGFDVSWVIGTAGDPAWAAGLVVILAAVCFAAGRRRLALLAVAGPVATGLVTTVVKPLVDRTINGDHLSYPSGHTALLTSLGIVVGLLLTDRFRLGRAAGPGLVLGLALLCAAAMSWSQTSSRVHYLTDTLGGFCSALALVTAAGLIIDRVADRVKVNG
ncbi:phosphatase PAP2 family protein [Amycolatopsis thermophila]|uniref:Undecaprenyl-diphosphatase n=1 Tax=Amycolatopsis thermophila TaxID=206084 RepID=A0ABU0EQU2_9PSEU|nr:phosphatase PAP2 family protein [Amycolatopsis thermophila]MDQ0377654.1 undecaprenyl-diphosphatase [Amycolatopsis thermophila]